MSEPKRERGERKPTKASKSAKPEERGPAALSVFFASVDDEPTDEGLPQWDVDEPGRPIELVEYHERKFHRLVRRRRRIIELVPPRGYLVREETTDGSGRPTGSEDYGYDGQHRLIRRMLRDGSGKVIRVTTFNYCSDGKISIVVTDYTTDPATVTTTEFNPNASAPI